MSADIWVLAVGGISFRRLKNGRRTGKILDYAVRYIQNLQMQCGIADGR